MTFHPYNATQCTTAVWYNVNHWTAKFSTSSHRRVQLPALQWAKCRKALEKRAGVCRTLWKYRKYQMSGTVSQKQRASHCTIFLLNSELKDIYSLYWCTKRMSVFFALILSRIQLWNVNYEKCNWKEIRSWNTQWTGFCSLSAPTWVPLCPIKTQFDSNYIRHRQRYRQTQTHP